jgi:hypothetical protein
MPPQVPRKKRKKQYYKGKNISSIPELPPTIPEVPPTIPEVPPYIPELPPSMSISRPPPTRFADVDKARMLSLPQRMPAARYSTTDNGAGVFTPRTRARFTPDGRASFTETTKDRRFIASPPPYASLDQRQRPLVGGQMSNNMQRKTKRRRNKNTNRIRNKYTNRRRNNSIRLH